MKLEHVQYIFKELVGHMAVYHSLGLWTRGHSDFKVGDVQVIGSDGQVLTLLCSKRRYEYRSSRADKQCVIWHT